MIAPFMITLSAFTEGNSGREFAVGPVRRRLSAE